MTIRLNNEMITIDANEISVHGLLELHQMSERKGLAVAVNDSVIPKSNWQEHHVLDNDNILIITATQGG